MQMFTKIQNIFLQGNMKCIEFKKLNVWKIINCRIIKLPKGMVRMVKVLQKIFNF
jgi:hypothetical protein